MDSDRRALAKAAGDGDIDAAKALVLSIERTWPDNVSKVQRAILEVIRGERWNAFDGARVVADLEANRAHWISVYMGREGSGITLRDMPDGRWNADVMDILVPTKSVRRMKTVVKRWDADSVTWRTEGQSSDFMGTSERLGRIVTLWWD